MHSDDFPLAKRKLLDRLHHRVVGTPALGRVVGGVCALRDREVLERLGFDGHDERPVGRLVTADARAHAARSPVVAPELVDDRAAHSCPEIALQVLVAQVRPAMQGIHEAEHPGGLEVFALHAVARNPARDLADHPCHDVTVLLDGSLHGPTPLQRSSHAKNVEKTTLFGKCPGVSRDPEEVPPDSPLERCPLARDGPRYDAC